MSADIAKPWDRYALRDAAIVFLASRLLLTLVGVLTIAAIDPNLEAVHGGGLDTLFCRWDCGWYLDLVREEDE